MFSSLFLRLYFAIEKMFFSFSLVILVGYSYAVSTYKSNSQRKKPKRLQGIVVIIIVLAIATITTRLIGTSTAKTDRW